jgi:hypothetical protein
VRERAALTSTRESTMGEEKKQFAVGDRVKCIQSDGYAALDEQSEFVIESVDPGSECVTVRTGSGLQSFWAWRFEKIAAPKRLFYREAGDIFDDAGGLTGDLTDFADGTVVEVFEFVKRGTVKVPPPAKQPEPTVE